MVSTIALISLIIVLMGICVCLYIYIPNKIASDLGYSFILTLITCIIFLSSVAYYPKPSKDIYGVMKPPSASSIATYLSLSGIAVIGLSSLTFWCLGAFDKTPKENNDALVYNYLILVGVMMGSSMFLMRSKLNRYLVLFLLTFLAGCAVALFNPHQMMDKYGPSIVMSFVLAISGLLTLIAVGQQEGFVGKIASSLLPFIVSGSLLIWLIYTFANLTTSWTTVGFYTSMTLIGATLVYSLVKQSIPEFLKPVVNVLFYIPALISGATEKITHSPEIALLMAELALLVSYLYGRAYLTKGWKKLQAIDPTQSLVQTAFLDETTTINTLELNGKYQFGLSFDVKIDATNAGNIYSAPILTYGDMIQVLYDVPANMLVVYMDKRQISVVRNVGLQKWNSVVINYDGGTVDVFYNGALQNSAIEIVPEMANEQLIIGPNVGENNGTIGQIENVNYFDAPIALKQIRRLNRG